MFASIFLTFAIFFSYVVVKNQAINLAGQDLDKEEENFQVGGMIAASIFWGLFYLMNPPRGCLLLYISLN